MVKNRKHLMVVLSFGCLLIVAGCILKVTSVLQSKPSNVSDVVRLSVGEAITGEVGYYGENENLIVIYNAKNKAEHDVTISKITFSLYDFTADKEVYKKVIDVNEVVKAKGKKEITLEGIEWDAEDLVNYFIKTEVE